MVTFGIDNNSDWIYSLYFLTADILYKHLFSSLDSSISVNKLNKYLETHPLLSPPKDLIIL